MAYAPHKIMDEIAAKRRIDKVEQELRDSFDASAALQAHKVSERKIKNAKAAFERRFGKSMLPLGVRPFIHANGGQCVRIFDRETGSWAEYNVRGWRITRMRDHDEMA